ncbi:MAG: NifU family protein [Nocardioidaceae bacterium]|nr:NifU family protein [Marmoricola sp.]
MDHAPIPVHPEAYEGDERRVRWVIPANILDFVGEAVVVPEALGELVTKGVLSKPILVEGNSVVLQIAEGLRWRDIADLARDGLQSALNDPAGWATTPGCEDNILREIVLEVLAGDVGAYVHNHGGSIRLLGVHDQSVAIVLGGSCRGCPARTLTLTGRFEAEVKKRYPRLKRVEATS